MPGSESISAKTQPMPPIEKGYIADKSAADERGFARIGKAWRTI
jgi:hypothetical protein